MMEYELSDAEIYRLHWATDGMHAIAKAQRKKLLEHIKEFITFQDEGIVELCFHGEEWKSLLEAHGIAP